MRRLTTAGPGVAQVSVVGEGGGVVRLAAVELEVEGDGVVAVVAVDPGHKRGGLVAIDKNGDVIGDLIDRSGIGKQKQFKPQLVALPEGEAVGS